MGNIYEFGKDILENILFRAGCELTGSGYEDIAKSYIWRSYLDMLKTPRLSTKKDPPGIISTVARVSNTATSTEGSASVTLGTSIATSMAGRKIMFDDERIAYRITAHTAGTTALTLDATYKDDAKSAAACSIFQDEYDLASDCLYPWKFWYRDLPQYTISFVNSLALGGSYPGRTLSTTSGPVSMITLIGTRKVRIAPWTEDAETIEYDYTIQPTELNYTGSGSGDTPIIELAERYLLADAALLLLMIDKNDARFGAVANVASISITADAAHRSMKNRPRMHSGRK